MRGVWAGGLRPRDPRVRRGLAAVDERGRAQCADVRVRGISVAVQLEKEVLPRLDASLSDSRYALGIMQFQTRAVTNHVQAHLARQWSWAARAVLPNRYRYVGAELGRRLHCTSLSRLWEGHSLTRSPSTMLCGGRTSLARVPLTDHSIRGRCLADAFSRRHIDALHAQFVFSCLWWSPRLPCLAREEWKPVAESNSSSSAQ